VLAARRRIAIAASTVFGIAVTFFVGSAVICLLFGGPDQTDHHAPYHQSEQDNQHFLRASILLSLREVLSCAWRVIHGNADAVIALFTIILAFVTTALAFYTARMSYEASKASGIAQQAANAARDSADAVVNAARPVLLARVVRSGELALPNRLGLPYQPKIYFVFDNHGAGVATITSVTAEIFVLQDIPAVPDFSQSREFKDRWEVIPGNFRFPDDVKVSRMNAFIAHPSKPITDMKDIEALGSGDDSIYKRFYLIGKVEYKDTLGFEYEGGFSLKVFENMQQGARDSKGRLNYYKYRKKGEEQWRHS
jgi:hypothetical protein